MADKRRRRGDTSRRLWILIGLGAFLVLDVVLVSMALTRDGGATWEQFPIAPAVEVSSIQRLHAADDAYIYMVGQRPADCSLVWAGTFTGGADWGVFEAQLGDTWFVDATNRARVHAPGGDQAAPCDAVVGLAITSATEAAALCSTQTVFRTADGAATWDAGLPMPGAVSLDNSDDGYIVATVGQPDCAGVQVRTIGVSASDADAIPALGCLALESAPDETSVSYASGSVWVWADDTVRASTDGGVTWE